MEEQEIGLVANNLEEAIDYVKCMSSSEYMRISSNVQRVGALVKEVFFTKQLLMEIQNYLFLEKRKENDHL